MNDKIISFRIKPYEQEANLLMWIDTLIILLVLTVMLIARFPWWAILVPILVYLTYAMIFHYRVIIQAKLDRRNGEYVTEVVSVLKFGNEFSGASNGNGDNYIRFFYPREVHVDKYRIYVVNSNGEKRKLRSMMSTTRFLNLCFMKLWGVEHLQITYLKRSKILLRVDLIEEINAKRKERRRIEKVIQKINNAI